MEEEQTETPSGTQLKKAKQPKPATKFSTTTADGSATVKRSSGSIVNDSSSGAAEKSSSLLLVDKKRLECASSKKGLWRNISRIFNKNSDDEKENAAAAAKKKKKKKLVSIFKPCKSSGGESESASAVGVSPMGYMAELASTKTNNSDSITMALKLPFREENETVAVTVELEAANSEGEVVATEDSVAETPRSDETCARLCEETESKTVFVGSIKVPDSTVLTELTPVLVVTSSDEAENVATGDPTLVEVKVVDVLVGPEEDEAVDMKDSLDETARLATHDTSTQCLLRETISKAVAAQESLRLFPVKVEVSISNPELEMELAADKTSPETEEEEATSTMSSENSDTSSTLFVTDMGFQAGGGGGYRNPSHPQRFGWFPHQEPPRSKTDRQTQVFYLAVPKPSPTPRLYDLRKVEERKFRAPPKEMPRAEIDRAIGVLADVRGKLSRFAENRRCYRQQRKDVCGLEETGAVGGGYSSDELRQSCVGYVTCIGGSAFRAVGDGDEEEVDDDDDSLHFYRMKPRAFGRDPNIYRKYRKGREPLSTVSLDSAAAVPIYDDDDRRDHFLDEERISQEAGKRRQRGNPVAASPRRPGAADEDVIDETLRSEIAAFDRLIEELSALKSEHYQEEEQQQQREDAEVVEVIVNDEASANDSSPSPMPGKIGRGESEPTDEAPPGIEEPAEIITGEAQDLQPPSEGVESGNESPSTEEIAKVPADEVNTGERYRRVDGEDNKNVAEREKTYMTVEKDITSMIQELLKESKDLKETAVLNGAVEDKTPPFTCSTIKDATTNRADEYCQLIFLDIMDRAVEVAEAPPPPPPPPEDEEEEKAAAEQAYVIASAGNPQPCGDATVELKFQQLAPAKRLNPALEATEDAKVVGGDNRQTIYFCSSTEAAAPRIPKTSWSFGESRLGPLPPMTAPRSSRKHQAVVGGDRLVESLEKCSGLFEGLFGDLRMHAAPVKHCDGQEDRICDGNATSGQAQATVTTTDKAIRKTEKVFDMRPGSQKPTQSPPPAIATHSTDEEVVLKMEMPSYGAVESTLDSTNLLANLNLVSPKLSRFSNVTRSSVADASTSSDEASASQASTPNSRRRRKSKANSEPRPSATGMDISIGKVYEETVVWAESPYAHLSTTVATSDSSSITLLTNHSNPSDPDYEGDCDNFASPLIPEPRHRYQSQPRLNTAEEIEAIERNVRENDLLEKLSISVLDATSVLYRDDYDDDGDEDEIESSDEVTSPSLPSETDRGVKK